MKGKTWLYMVVLLMCSFFITSDSQAQCSICTKTAQQMGEKPAKGLNAGILYLAFAPLAIGAYIGLKWWKHNRDAD